MLFSMSSRICLALLTVSAFAQMPAEMEKKLTSKIEGALTKSGAPSVSVAVVQDGVVTFARAFGNAGIATNRAATPETRYAAGSISKQFTAAALLLLQELGTLSLNDKVSKYFPQMTRAGEITLRQLLNHTAGYEDFAPQDYIIPEWTRPTAPGATLDVWAKKPLNFDPGTKWQYSNTNYVLAAAIFEKAAGRPLMAFLREKIFAPLGMASTGSCEDASPADATAYTRYGLGPARQVAREAKGWYFGAGEVCSTASDLAKWDIAFLKRQILSARSYQEFTREAVLANGDRTHYALGLQLGEQSRMPVIFHGGEVSGFLALNRVFPTRNVAIVTLSNEDGIGLLGPLSADIAATLILPDLPPADEKDTRLVRNVLEDLHAGKIRRDLFSANANAYFTETGIRDLKQSLRKLGRLKAVTRTGESLRGGMTHRRYSAVFEKTSVNLNIYLLPDGKFEQFMVMEEF